MEMSKSTTYADRIAIVIPSIRSFTYERRKGVSANGSLSTSSPRFLRTGEILIPLNFIRDSEFVIKSKIWTKIVTDMGATRGLIGNEDKETGRNGESTSKHYAVGTA